MNKNQKVKIDFIDEMSKNILMNIPTFPKFKKLALSDKENVLLLLKPYPPYSDFNFTSLWSYNVKDDVVVSLLNNNLVIRFRDYITNEPFYSFLGTSNVIDTINQLLQFTRSLGERHPSLKLIPEANIKGKSEIDKMFTIVEDRDNFDYVLSISEWCDLQTSRYSSQRKMINRFFRRNPGSGVTILDLNNKKTTTEIFDLFNKWEETKKRSREDTKHELVAIQRTIRDKGYLSLFSMGLYKNAELIGFIIADLENEKYAESHFLKYIASYSGINHILHHSMALELQKKGYEYINIEQDLGLPGLRITKEQAKPITYLKKYIITPK